MTIKIKRKQNENGCIVMHPDTNDYTVIVCANTTKTEHGDIKDKLEKKYNNPNINDIYYSKKLVSIYIMQLNELSSFSKNKAGKFIKGILPDLERNVIYQKVVYGQQMTGVKVTTSREGIKVTTSYASLLEIPYK